MSMGIARLWFSMVEVGRGGREKMEKDDKVCVLCVSWERMGMNHSIVADTYLHFDPGFWLGGGESTLSAMI